MAIAEFGLAQRPVQLLVQERVVARPVDRIVGFGKIAGQELREGQRDRLRGCREVAPK
ncbi:MAG: hypothetical protein AB7O55_29425 [Lautropia sp.]